MRSFAHHDRTGVIHSVVLVDAPDGVRAGVEPDLGVIVSETDGIALGDDADNLDGVRRFLDGRKVEVIPPSRVTFVDRA